MNDVVVDRLERMARFVKRMNEVERDLSSPYVRPKDAATLILVDRAGPVPKVLLGKRHHGHKFMPSIRPTGACRSRTNLIHTRKRI